MPRCWILWHCLHGDIGQHGSQWAGVERRGGLGQGLTGSPQHCPNNQAVTQCFWDDCNVLLCWKQEQSLWSRRVTHLVKQKTWQFAYFAFNIPKLGVVGGHFVLRFCLFCFLWSTAASLVLVNRHINGQTGQGVGSILLSLHPIMSTIEKDMNWWALVQCQVKESVLEPADSRPIVQPGGRARSHQREHASLSGRSRRLWQEPWPVWGIRPLIGRIRLSAVACRVWGPYPEY